MQPRPGAAAARREGGAGPRAQTLQRMIATHRPQAFLEGSGSFMLEGQTAERLPPVAGDAQALYQDYLPEAVVRRPGHRGWFTVVDGRGRVRWTFKEYPAEEWQGWHLLVLVALHTPPEYLAYLRRCDIGSPAGTALHDELAGAYTIRFRFTITANDGLQFAGGVFLRGCGACGSGRGE